MAVGARRATIGRLAKKSRRPATRRVSDPFGKKRGDLMAKVRSRNTGFERLVFATLRKRGVIFETHAAGIPGRPDLLVLALKRAVFLDSDFWHGWNYPRWKDSLKNDFWRDKIEANRKRDRRTAVTLRRRGWAVLRVWEHEIGREFDKSMSRIAEFISQSPRALQKN